jgi:hypothetical protein
LENGDRVVEKKPHAKILAIEFFDLLSSNAEFTCSINNAKDKDDIKQLGLV